MPPFCSLAPAKPLWVFQCVDSWLGSQASGVRVSVFWFPSLISDSFLSTYPHWIQNLDFHRRLLFRMKELQLMQSWDECRMVCIYKLCHGCLYSVFRQQWFWFLPLTHTIEFFVLAATTKPILWSITLKMLDMQYFTVINCGGKLSWRESLRNWSRNTLVKISFKIHSSFRISIHFYEFAYPM